MYRLPIFYLLLLAVVGHPFVVDEAQSQTCCQPRTSSQTRTTGIESERAMYALASFRDAHLAPEPFTYVSESGRIITFAAPDGVNGRGYFIPSPKKSDRYLLVFHEWWGLNDYIEREAERWQQELGDVNVIAVDLFDGKVATTPEAAQKQTGEARPERMTNIIKGAIAYAGPTAKIATIGWCFGGGWALQASLLAAAKTKATVMYYGMPELDVKKLRKLHGPVIEFFGSKDQFINQEKAVAFQKAAKAAKKRLFEYTYTADHAFANPSNPKYDKAATASAHVKALAFLKQYFLK